MLQVEVRQDVSQVMKNDRVQKSLLIWAGYFSGILLLRLINGGLGAVVRLETPLLLVGGLLGMIVWMADRLVYVYYTRPQEPMSVEVKELVKQKRYRQVIEVLWHRGHEQSNLAMNNVLFLGVWCGLALFIVTSSPSAFAKGLVAGIGLELVWGLVRDWKDKEYLMGRLFWPVRRRVELEELRVVVGGFIGVFGLVSLFLT